MDNDDLMRWIATGNQIAIDWYVLTHEGSRPPVTRYVPPELTGGYTVGTSLDFSRVLILGVLVVIAVYAFK